jgi:folylpolyglutamate synthase/dihydropteroate synthase
MQDWREAIRQACLRSNIVVACGSLYLISQIRAWLCVANLEI